MGRLLRQTGIQPGGAHMPSYIPAPLPTTGGSFVLPPPIFLPAWPQPSGRQLLPPSPPPTMTAPAGGAPAGRRVSAGVPPGVRELIAPLSEAERRAGPSMGSRLISGGLGALVGGVLALGIVLPGGRFNSRVAATELTRQYMRLHEGHMWLAAGAAAGGLFGLATGALDPRGAGDLPHARRRQREEGLRSSIGELPTNSNSTPLVVPVR